MDHIVFNLMLSVFLETYTTDVTGNNLTKGGHLTVVSHSTSRVTFSFN